MTTGPATAIQNSNQNNSSSNINSTTNASSRSVLQQQQQNHHFNSHLHRNHHPTPAAMPECNTSTSNFASNSNNPTTHHNGVISNTSSTNSNPGSSPGGVGDECGETRHPLENVWVLWFLQASSTPGKWEDNLKIVHKFSTVEDFWSLFNHIKPASQLVKGCDYCLFKDGIIPKWEDEKNKLGGRWVLPIPKTVKEEVDKYWLETLLCLIGEAFDDDAGALVNGCVVSVRPRGDRVCIWVGNTHPEYVVTQIGRKIKERLKLKPTTTLNFQAHDDAITRNNSTARNMYQV